MPRSRFAQHVPPFHVMALLARAQALAAEGHDVIHLEVGEPDFPTPPAVNQAIQQAMNSAPMGYTPAAGLPALRQAISQYYADYYDATVPASRVIVTPGASGALQLALAAAINPGDGVLVTDPGYPCNRQFVALVGGVPQPVVLDAARQFRLAADDLWQAWQPTTRLAMVASPDNPSGNVIAVDDLGQMAHGCVQRGGLLLVDEIYQGLCYQQRPASVLAQTDQVLVINSFSKYFSMTGWRLGWMVVPDSWAPVIERLAQNLFLAPSTPAQYGALAAFQDNTLALLEQRRQVLAARRQTLLDGLARLGLPVASAAEGAFYVYVDISRCAEDSFVFAQRLLEQAKVAVTPGIDFGNGHGPARYIRIAYTCDEARLRQAMDRLQQFLQSQAS